MGKYLLKIKITEETAFELGTDGKNLILSPQADGEDAQKDDFEPLLEKINMRYGAVLRRLGE